VDPGLRCDLDWDVNVSIATAEATCEENGDRGKPVRQQDERGWRQRPDQVRQKMGSEERRATAARESIKANQSNG